MTAKLRDVFLLREDGEMDVNCGAEGVVYLLHFDPPYKHARHYVGWTKNLPARIKKHFAGHGSRLMQVVVAAGIKASVARTWCGGRTLERQIKNMKNTPQLCPVCNPVAMGRASTT
jgi:predicted GIY-YIG superfamily endonuclease